MGKRLIGSVGLADSGVPDDLLTTKGDTHGFSSTNARIPIGDDDQVLTADSSEALGLKWATASGGATITTQEISPTDDQTTTSGSVAVTNGSATLATRTGGVVLATYFQSANSTVADQIVLALYYNGSIQTQSNSRLATTGQSQLNTISTTDDLDGGSLACYWGTGGGTAQLKNASTNMTRCTLFEVS